MEKGGGERESKQCQEEIVWDWRRSAHMQPADGSPLGVGRTK